MLLDSQSSSFGFRNGGNSASTSGAVRYAMASEKWDSFIQ
jgi:hypothetical protein